MGCWGRGIMQRWKGDMEAGVEGGGAGGEMRGPALGRDEGCTTLRMTKKLLDCSLSIAFSGKFYITCIFFLKVFLKKRIKL